MRKKYRLYEVYDNDIRVISTGMTFDKAFDVVESTLGQLSDGIWENSSVMEQYWRFITVDVKNNEVVLLVQAEDSERINSGSRPMGRGKLMRVVSTYKTVYNRFSNMSDDEVKKWIAAKVKTVVKTEEKDSGRKLWDRSCNIELTYMSKGVLAKDAYRVYDALLGRKERFANDSDLEETEEDEELQESRRWRHQKILRENKIPRNRFLQKSQVRKLGSFRYY